MPIVEYVGGGVYHSRSHSNVTAGDRIDVSTGKAAYLCDDRDDFVRVDADIDERVEQAIALSEEHWQSTVSIVEAGDADDYLDELADVDDRDSVQAAIDERRATLEG